MNLLVNGMIESAQIPDENGVCIKFDFTSGKEWHLHSGIQTGVSQHAYKSMQTNDRIVWNFPFELIYRTNDISGWPKVCVSLTSRDFLGRDVVCGYGVVHVPTQPGKHTRYVQIFKPKSSSYLIDMIGSITGKPAEYYNPVDLLQKTTGREVSRVETTGVVKIQFNICSRNMEALGFQNMSS